MSTHAHWRTVVRARNVFLRPGTCTTKSNYAYQHLLLMCWPTQQMGIYGHILELCWRPLRMCIFLLLLILTILTSALPDLRLLCRLYGFTWSLKIPILHSGVRCPVFDSLHGILYVRSKFSLLVLFLISVIDGIQPCLRRVASKCKRRVISSIGGRSLNSHGVQSKILNISRRPMGVSPSTGPQHSSIWLISWIETACSSVDGGDTPASLWVYPLDAIYSS